MTRNEIYEAVENGVDVTIKKVTIADISDVRIIKSPKRYQVHSENRFVKGSLLFENLSTAVAAFENILQKVDSHERVRAKKSNRKLSEVPVAEKANGG